MSDTTTKPVAFHELPDAARMGYRAAFGDCLTEHGAAYLR